MTADIDRFLNLVKSEIEQANKKFPMFDNPHYGYAVLLEEVDELWDEIKSKKKSAFRMQEEAIQVAAMAIKFLMSINNFNES